MTYPNTPDFRREFPPEAEQGGSFTATTWASLAFILLLFGGVALWAYSSGDMQTAAVKRPGTEQSAPPTTTGQGGGASKAPIQDGAK